MQLFIPPLGTRLRLLETWQFPLHAEYRNSDVWDVLAGVERKYVYGEPPPVAQCELPATTVLVVDRIYIRKGQTGFDSLTFRVDYCPNKAILPKSKGGTLQYRQARFWVKLEDANKLNVETV